MNFNVEMLAFDDGKIRCVEVPDHQIIGDLDHDLEVIFRFGQNEVQSKNHPSVSVGDIINYGNKKYLVANVGFKLIDDMTYQNYLNLPSRERHFLSSFQK